MITKEQLQDFAVQNGLFLHPTNPLDAHVERVNAKNGACPCDPDNRVCPCDDAVTDCNNPQKPDKEKCCTCRIFVSQEYLDAWGYGTQSTKKRPKTRSVVTAQVIDNHVDAPAQSADSDVPKEVYDSAVAIIATAKHAKGMLQKDPAQASDYLMQSLEKLDCPTCEAFFVANALRCQTAAIMCSSGGEEDCVKATKEAEDGLVRIVDLYEQVAGIKQPEEPTKPGDKRRACIGSNLKSDELEEAIAALRLSDNKAIRNLRFYISTKMCSQNPISVEEGIAMALEEHSEWFGSAG